MTLRKYLLILGIISACIFSSSVWASTAHLFQLKTVLLYRLLQFTHWPERAIPNPGEPWTVCTAAPNVWGGALKALSLQSLDGRSIDVRYSVTQSQLSECHAVVLKGSFRKEQRVLKRIRHLPILTVGDRPEFLEVGGIVSFVAVGNRVKFLIDLPNAKKAAISLSASMLMHAHQVKR